MTDNEIIKALECCQKNVLCEQCPLNEKSSCINKLSTYALDFIARQQAEIERLKDEVSKTRRKALLEAKSKFAGHSDYHGDTILCKLICMAEGKEVEIATPLDKSEIKSEAIKEFVEKLHDKAHYSEDFNEMAVYCFDIDNLLKEMVGDTE